MRRFLSDAAFTVTSQLVSAMGALVIQIYVARTVSLGDYGRYAVIQSFVLVVEAIFVARGGEVALQYIGQYWKVDMPRALWYRVRLGRLDARMNVFIYLLVVFVGYLLSARLNFRWDWLALLALSIPAQIGYGVWKSIFIVDGRLKNLAYLEIICSVLLVILTISFTTWLGIRGLLIAFVLGGAVKTLLTRSISQGYWPSGLVAVPPGEYDEMAMSRFRSANIHSIVRNAFTTGASQGDLLLVNALRGPEAAGLYKAAKTIAAIPIRAVTPAWVALRPRIMASMRNHDVGRVRRLLILPGALLAGLGVIGALPLARYGEALVTFAFGDTYCAATSVALWLLLGTWVFGAVSGWLNFACVITSRKIAGSMIYFIWLAGIIVGGVLWGKESATAMGMVAAASMALAALAGWVYFMRADAWVDMKGEMTS